MGDEEKPTCFVAMPITTHKQDAERYGGDDRHWEHVIDTLFVPAVERAGYRAIKPVASGAHMIHGEIVKNLSESAMVLCDLSGLNPNVFFELGVRTALNKPVALVRDEHVTSIPFDTNGINTHSYKSSLNGWDVESEVHRLAAHLTASADSCREGNPMWRHFGLTITANQPTSDTSTEEARLELMRESILDLRREVLDLGRMTGLQRDLNLSALPGGDSRLVSEPVTPLDVLSAEVPQSLDLLARRLAKRFRAISAGYLPASSSGHRLYFQMEDVTMPSMAGDHLKQIGDLVAKHGYSLKGYEQDAREVLVTLSDARDGGPSLGPVVGFSPRSG